MNATRVVMAVGIVLGIVGWLVPAQEDPHWTHWGVGAYRLGVGARALSLGKAFTAVASDAEGLYWNPAGLAWASLNIGGMYSNPFSGLGGGAVDYRVQYLGVVGTVRGVGLGGGWFNAHVGGIPLTEEGGTFDYSSSIFLVGAAARVALGEKALAAAGLTGKLYQERMLEGRAQGVGFDVGVIVDFGTVRVAYCSQDVGGTWFQWRGTGQEPETEVPWIHRLGVAVRWFEGALLTTGEAALGDWVLPIETKIKPSLRLGAEWTLFEVFALRAGVQFEPIPNAGYRPIPSAGLGVAWSAFVLDAAYLRDPIPAEAGGSFSTDTFVFSVGLRF